MTSMQFLIDTILGLYLIIVLLRLWLQLARADFYNPMSQAVVKATHPIVGPMRRFIPSLGKFDTSTFILAIVVAGLNVFLSQLVIGNQLPLVSVAILAVMEVFSQIYWMILIVLIIRVVMSWISPGANPVEYLLQQLTEPMLAPIRRVLPPMGGFDLSILVLIVGIQFISFLIKDISRAFL